MQVFGLHTCGESMIPPRCRGARCAARTKIDSLKLFVAMGALFPCVKVNRKTRMIVERVAVVIFRRRKR